MAEETLVRGDARLRALDLSLAGLAAQLPGQFTNLCDCLRGDSFAEAREPPTRVDGNSPPPGRVAAPP